VTAEGATSLTLLQRARAKDSDAWGRLVNLYTPLIHYWCKHWGVHGADADDVRQEVFQAVAAGLADFSRAKAGETFRAWLRGITRHKIMDFFRAAQQRPAAHGGTDAQLRLQQVPGPDADLPDAPPEELSALYHRMLALLKAEFEPKTWQAFWRVAVDGQSASDVAAELGMTAVAVRKAKSRVLHRLREEAGDLLGAGEPGT
jgi:RNA polymerase sigma-70 factor (ECF subfamily)